MIFPREVQYELISDMELQKRARQFLSEFLLSFHILMSVTVYGLAETKIFWILPGGTSESAVK